MPHPSVERPASALRRRMLEDMAMRGLREATQRDYIRFVRAFAAFLGRSPDTASADDVRCFQVPSGRDQRAGADDQRLGVVVPAIGDDHDFLGAHRLLGLAAH